MSEWTQLAQPVRCSVELDKPLVTRRERGALVQGDKNANAIVMEVYHTSGKPFDLTGHTVTLNFVRPDNLAVEPIAAETAGNIAVATLTEICYRVSGLYAASMSIQQGNVDRTVLRITGDVISTENDGTVSDEKILPTPEELLQTLIQVEQARNAASEAAESANNAAIRANQAANAIENASASAETLPTGQNATVSVNGMHFTFGLPRGEKGEKGDPGTIENVTITSINGLPEALAGKLPSDGTAVNARKLGGKAPEYYLSPRNLLDNSDFRNPVNQRGKTSYNSGGYTIDRWAIWIESGAGNVSIMDGYISVWFDEHGTIYQRFDKGVLDLSKQYSLAIKKHDGSLIVSYPAYIRADLYSDNDFVNLADLTNGNTLEIEWCALYEGAYTAENLPPYVPKGYAAELAECQRYFQLIKSGYPVLGNAYSIGTDSAQMALQLERSMRYPPTVTIDDTKIGLTFNGVYLYATGATWQTDMSVFNPCIKALLTFANSSFPAVGYPCVPYLDADIYVSADL